MAGAREMTKLSAVLEGLKSVSDPYTAMYAVEMKRLRDNHEIEYSKLGLIAICWLFLARRPLRVGELVHALAIDEDVSLLDEKNVPLMSNVLKACAGLVVVNDAHNTVGLFHKTLHEYLVKNQSAWFPHGNDIIGTTCVRYLSLDAFADGPCTEVDPASSWSVNTSKDYAISYEEPLIRYSLYEYVSEHWHDHIRGSDLETADIIINFLAKPRKVSASCQRSGHRIPRTTGVHVATQLLLERSLERHLQSCETDPNAKDHTGRRPLTYAAELDGVGVMNHLINAGADVDSEDSDSNWRAPGARTALSCAASKGNLSACEVLLKGGANVNYRDFHNRSALSFAAEYGSVAVARFLLQSGARMDPQDLSWAGATESTEVVSLFLKHGADIDLSEGLSTFLLIRAAETSSVPLISFLVEHGGKVNAMHSTGETPLCRAVHKKHIESVRFLIDAGADVNRRFLVPHPLVQATSNGSKEIAHLLISAGSEVNVQDRMGLTPLAYAAREGWTDVVQLLLDKGADPNGTNDDSESVLTFAAGSGSVEAVKMLLQHGTDSTRSHGLFPYCIPLYMALGAESLWIIRGRTIDERMLEFLLSKGANPNQVMDWEPEWDKMLDPPLLHALKYLPKDDDLTGRLVRLLLEHEARTDILSIEGLSVLECAKHHPKEVQDMLRRYGAK
jgi:ankyrin repeat protein